MVMIYNLGGGIFISIGFEDEVKDGIYSPV